MSINIEKIKKIKSNYFMNTDRIALDLVFEKAVSKEIQEENIIAQIDGFIDEVKSVLMTGPSWEFNPTCSKIYKKTFEIDDKKLLQFLKNESFVDIEELDVNQNFVSITIPVKLLIGNAKQLSDDLLLKSEDFLITTMLGEITL